MDKSFTIIVLPDCQRYVERGYREERLFCFEKQIKWILDNNKIQNICFVTSVGDIVHHRNHLDERKAFFECMSGLKNNVAFGFCAGNHDLLFGESAKERLHGRGKSVDYTEFESTEICDFQERFIDSLRKEEWWVDDRNFGQSSVQIFSALGQKYMMLHLEYGASDETLEWADKWIRQNSHIPTIITTHMFITPEEPQGITRRESRLSTYQHNMVGEGDNAGEDIWEKLILPNDNVFCVLCGHYSDERCMVLSRTKSSRKVVALLSDYELCQPYGGNGWMRLLTITPAEKSIRVETYTPVFDEYKTDEKSCFVIDNIEILG